MEFGKIVPESTSLELKEQLLQARRLLLNHYERWLEYTREADRKKEARLNRIRKMERFRTDSDDN